uniref:CWF19-like protein 1 n=1 Tax=Phallusia mammillata TaxID=59560 RepID=A0A6F9DB37_9ASCI|nr:CWF19-like protein 1 [Phallusia mammillata]
MDSPLKLLVCGDVQGKFNVIFSRIEKLLKKGNKFDMLLCVGDFFGDGVVSKNAWQEYKSGAKLPPLPTYILGPNSIQQLSHFEENQDAGFELCENITFLGKKGLFTTSTGLRIAYLSGCESPDVGPKQPHCFTAGDAQTITASLDTSNAEFKGVDILITSVWPKNVTSYGNPPISDNCKSCGSPIVAQLCKDIRPRYHFAALEGIHYERVPFRNHTVLAENARHVTRFIALAPVGNTSKQKYLYAFSIMPMVKMNAAELIQQPPDTTESPFKVQTSKTTPANSNNGEINQYRWNMDQPQGNNRKRKSNNNFNNPPRKQSRPQDWSCWFCLGGEKVEKHLVASVGELCYVALAKGGLTWDHVLVLPIAHHPSSLDLPDDTVEEAKKYKQALVKAFKEDGRSCIFFERCYRTDHMQIQAIPLPKDTDCETVKKEFFKLAESHTDRQGKPAPLELTELPKQTDLKQILPAGCPFFHVELPDGSRLLHRIQRYFPLQFGREALCSSSILNMRDRVDWRSCMTSRDQETDAAKRFRSFFEKHDFTADDEDDV